MKSISHSCYSPWLKPGVTHALHTHPNAIVNIQYKILHFPKSLFLAQTKQAYSHNRKWLWNSVTTKITVSDPHQTGLLQRHKVYTNNTQTTLHIRLQRHLSQQSNTCYSHRLKPHATQHTCLNPEDSQHIPTAHIQDECWW